MSDHAASSPPRATFYIDGFNLYHGAVRGTTYKWLDLEELCRRLRPADTLVRVRYFTSRVMGSAAQQRQMALWQALATRPLVRIEVGSFTRKPVTCEVASCAHTGDRNYHVVIEKRTDVSIGAHMVNDVARNECDVVALISGDTDLVPAVRLIRTDYPTKHVAVYVPIKPGAEAESLKTRRSDELRKAANRGGFLSPTLITECQLPNPVVTAQGHLIAKPSGW